MAKSTESNALTVTEQQSGELMQTHAASAAQHEIQSAIMIAKNYPRNEDECFARLMKSCGRRSFADGAEYSFPRGESKVTGPSVTLAREAARLWGNIQWGLDIVSDEDGQRTIRGWARDAQHNTRVEASATFGKLIQRKNRRTKTTEWVEPDERDLRELTNRHGAFCVRNCLLQLLPPDLIDDALAACAETLRSNINKDVDGERKKLITAFSAIHVEVPDLEEYLDHELRLCTSGEIADLRSVYKSIKDGNSTWAEHVGQVDGKTGGKGTTDINAEIDAMKGKPADSPATEPPADLPLIAPELLEGYHVAMTQSAEAGEVGELVESYTELTAKFSMEPEAAKSMKSLYERLSKQAKKNAAGKDQKGLDFDE